MIVLTTIDPIIITMRYTPMIVRLAWTHRRSMISIRGVIRIVMNPEIRMTTMSDSILYRIYPIVSIVIRMKIFLIQRVSSVDISIV